MFLEDFVMKNKLVLHIVIAYFILLCIVLVGQIGNKDNENIDRVVVETETKDKFQNTVVLYINSPMVIVDRKQFIIDKDDRSIAPVILNGKTYVPVRLLANTINASISWDENKREAVIRYNNKAAVFKENEKKVRIVDNLDDKVRKINGELVIINEKSYVPLKVITDIFDKNILFDRNLIVLSEKDNIIDPIKDKESIDRLIERMISIPAELEETETEAEIETETETETEYKE